MFGLVKAVVGVAVEVPVAIALDCATLGGLAVDKEKPYTVEAIEKVVENVVESTEPRRE